jgi:enamine deaminase RidA (YjgF/YER057c/UK114 family)
LKIRFALALENTVLVLNEAGAGPEHVVRMTWYVKGIDEYRENLSGIGNAWRSIMGKNFPTMAVVGVTDLVEKEALIEIETTAVIAKD